LAQDLSDPSALVARASSTLLIEVAAVLALNCRDGSLWRRLVKARQRPLHSWGPTGRRLLWPFGPLRNQG
jgi:hypothetical protein